MSPTETHEILIRPGLFATWVPKQNRKERRAKLKEKVTISKFTQPKKKRKR